MHDARVIANALIARHGVNTLTPLRVQKLTYLCHGWMLGLYGEPLSRQQVEAWRWGPVIPDLYYQLRQYGGQPVPELINLGALGFDPDDVRLSDREADLVGQIIEVYGDFTGPQLSTLCHKPGSPWDLIWRPGRSRTAVIPDRIIQRYYAELARRRAGN